MSYDFDPFDDVAHDAEDAAEALLVSVELALADGLDDQPPTEDDEELERAMRRRALDAEAQMRVAVEWMLRGTPPAPAPTNAPTSEPKDAPVPHDDEAPAPALEAIKPPAKWEPKRYDRPAQPGCYLSSQQRSGYLAVVKESPLHENARRFLRWLIGFKHPALSMGIESMAERVGGEKPLSESTIKRTLRLFDDTTPTGLGILRMVERDRGGVHPRVYEIDLCALTFVALERVAGKASKATAEVRQKSREKEKEKRRAKRKGAVTAPD